MSYKIQDLSIKASSEETAALTLVLGLLVWKDGVQSGRDIIKTLKSTNAPVIHNLVIELEKIAPPSYHEEATLIVTSNETSSQ